MLNRVVFTNLGWTIKIFIFRTKMGITELRRDRGALLALLAVVLALIYWVISLELDDDPTHNKTMMLFGIFLGSILGSGNRVSIIGYFNEKKSKMMSFLTRAGMKKEIYYGYHIFWNALIVNVLLQPLIISFDIVIFGRVDLSSIIICIFGSGSIAIFNLTLAIMFSNEITGLNFISMANFLASLLGSFTHDAKNLHIIKYASPQNNLIQFFSQKMKSNGIINDGAWEIGSTIIQFFFLGLIFYVVEKFIPNEYGTNEMSLKESVAAVFCKYKKKKYRTTNPEIINLMNNPDSPRESILSINDIKKDFDEHKVLKGVNLNLISGEILCLLGCNGAGKSTLFNILLGNIDATEGRIETSSRDEELSYCPQHDLYWDFFTVAEHFEFVNLLRREQYKEIHGLTTTTEMSELTSRFEDEEVGYGKKKANTSSSTLNSLDNIDRKNYSSKIKDICLLEDHWNVQACKLSGGYKRRLSLALALLCNTEMILLDEPTTALDIESRRKIMKSIRKAQKKLGKTILFTTHHLEDAENFADKIAILKQGKISLSGTVEELTSQFGSTMLIIDNVAVGEINRARTALSPLLEHNCEFEYDEKMKQVRVSINRIQEDRPLIIKALANVEKIKSVNWAMNFKRKSLEEVFLKEHDETEDLEGNVSINISSQLSKTWSEIMGIDRVPPFSIQFMVMLKKSNISHLI